MNKSTKTPQNNKIKPFVDKYNWKGKKFPSGNDDWNKLVKRNPTIVPNVSYICNERFYTVVEKIYPAYV